MSSLCTRAALPAVLLVSTLALAACGGDAPAPAERPPAAVTVVTLKSEPVTLTRELAGRAEASQQAEVRPQVGGIVERLLFTEGGSVRAGQPLYQLDQTAYRADAGSAQAAVARAQTALTNARQKAERTAELARTQMVSRQDNDNAQAALRQAQAELRAAQAGLQGANVPLGFTRVSAPISGRIGRSSVTRGALVTASQATPRAVIQDLDPMYVEISQSSAELLRLRRDLAAGRFQKIGSDEARLRLLLEDGSSYPLPGRIGFSGVSVNTATGGVTLRARFDNPEGVLMPGMYVRAVLETGTVEQALQVPQQALQRDARGAASVMVVDAQDKVERRAVVATRAFGNAWLIGEGLKAGERVIVEGLQKVRPGDTVKPHEVDLAAPAASAPAGPAR